MPNWLDHNIYISGPEADLIAIRNTHLVPVFYGDDCFFLFLVFKDGCELTEQEIKEIIDTEVPDPEVPYVFSKDYEFGTDWAEVLRRYKEDLGIPEATNAEFRTHLIKTLPGTFANGEFHKRIGMNISARGVHYYWTQDAEGKRHLHISFTVRNGDLFNMFGSISKKFPDVTFDMLWVDGCDSCRAKAKDGVVVRGEIEGDPECYGAGDSEFPEKEEFFVPDGGTTGE